MLDLTDPSQFYVACMRASKVAMPSNYNKLPVPIQIGSYEGVFSAAERLPNCTLYKANLTINGTAYSAHFPGGGRFNPNNLVHWHSKPITRQDATRLLFFLTADMLEYIPQRHVFATPHPDVAGYWSSGQ
jgi:hypothetical protein